MYEWQEEPINNVINFLCQLCWTSQTIFYSINDLLDYSFKQNSLTFGTTCWQEFILEHDLYSTSITLSREF